MDVLRRIFVFLLIQNVPNTVQHSVKKMKCHVLKEKMMMVVLCQISAFQKRLENAQISALQNVKMMKFGVQEEWMKRAVHYNQTVFPKLMHMDAPISVLLSVLKEQKHVLVSWMIMVVLHSICASIKSQDVHYIVQLIVLMESIHAQYVDLENVQFLEIVYLKLKDVMTIALFHVTKMRQYVPMVQYQMNVPMKMNIVTKVLITSALLFVQQNVLQIF